MQVRPECATMPIRRNRHRDIICHAAVALSARAALSAFPRLAGLHPNCSWSCMSFNMLHHPSLAMSSLFRVTRVAVSSPNFILFTISTIHPLDSSSPHHSCTHIRTTKYNLTSNVISTCIQYDSLPCINCNTLRNPSL